MKKLNPLLLLLAILICSTFFSSLSIAGNGGNGGHGGAGGRGGDGGHGTAGGHDGTPGMPGCDGGTDPSADGKFYIKGTTQECNPSSEDLKKR